MDMAGEYEIIIHNGNMTQIHKEVMKELGLRNHQRVNQPQLMAAIGANARFGLKQIDLKTCPIQKELN